MEIWRKIQISAGALAVVAVAMTVAAVMTVAAIVAILAV